MELLTETREASGVLDDSSHLLAEPGALRERALRDGCVLVRGAVDVAVVLALRRAVLGACARRGWLAADRPTMEGVARAGTVTPRFDDPALHAFQADVWSSPEMDAMRDEGGILKAVAAVVDGPVVQARRDTCRVFFPECEDRTTRPHQDAFFLRSSDEVWTAWIPLGDCPRLLGPLRVIRASHRQGIRAHAGPGPGYEAAESRDGDEWASADFSTGDLLLVHCLTVHAGMPNRDERLCRVSAGFRYGRAP